MTSLQTIVEHLDSILDPAAYDDYGPNGLQVPGRETVETVVTGVSANVELFARARDADADLVLVHHGLFWTGPPRPLDRAAKRRLQVLFDADMSLAAYHLPLDGHPEHGNNALLAEAIGCEAREPFGRHKRATIRVLGRPPRDRIAPHDLPPPPRPLRAHPRRHGPRAARLHRRPRPRADRRHRLRRRRRLPRGRDRRRPRRVRHRRADRAGDGPRAGGPRALSRRRPLRHRDLRRAPSRRPARGPVRRAPHLHRYTESDLSRRDPRNDRHQRVHVAAISLADVRTSRYMCRPIQTSHGRDICQWLIT